MSVTCEKCKRTREDSSFFLLKTGKRDTMCKDCLTMHVDNFNPDTYQWLLKRYDVPYNKAVWDNLLDKAIAKNPDGLKGNSVFGKYLRVMKLNQNANKTYADGDNWEEMKANEESHKAEEEAYENNLLELKANGEISEEEYQTRTHTKDACSVIYNADIPNQVPQAMFADVMQDTVDDLTLEDKKYLVLKWGNTYNPTQYIWLENFYQEMKNSYDVESAGREDTLKKICKTSMYMDEALDNADPDAYQKYTRMYDLLMKSGSFTEAQNKENRHKELDSIGEIVALCEKENGFIPKFEVEYPQDKIDYTLKDIKEYIYNLVTGDAGLGQQIEDYLKKMEQQQEQEDARDNTFITSKEEEANQAVTDNEMEDYQAYIDSQVEQDLLSMIEEDDDV